MTQRVTDPVILRDGTSAELRLVLPTDAPTLVEGFAALSEESRAARFLAPLSRLSASQIAYFTDVDGDAHVAFGVAVPEPTHPHGQRGLGIARYVRLPDEPGLAEVAVTVRDDAQGLGVGSLLFEALADHAREHGVDRFLAIMRDDNARMRALLERVGTLSKRELEGSGVVALTYALGEQNRRSRPRPSTPPDAAVA